MIVVLVTSAFAAAKQAPPTSLCWAPPTSATCPEVCKKPNTVWSSLNTPIGMERGEGGREEDHCLGEFPHAQG